MSVPTAGDGRLAGRMRVLEFVRFGAVGGSSTILYLAVYGAAVLAGVAFIPPRWLRSP